MRPIRQRSPGGCGSDNTDSTRLQDLIPDSQVIRPELYAGDDKSDEDDDSSDELSKGIDSKDSSDDDFGDMGNMNDFGDMGDDVVDMTNADEDEILKVFKAMSDEDGIIVKKDDDEIHLKDNEADTEYLIKLGESEEEEELDDAG